MVADLADGVVQALESLADGLPGHLIGLVDGGLQAEPSTDKVADDAVEEFLAAVYLLGCGRGMNPAGESFAAD